MIEQNIIGIATIILFLISLFNFINLRKTKRHIKQLLASTKKQDLETYLESLHAQSMNTNKQLSHLTEIYEEIKSISQKSLQKVALVRFNPFKDTGGDQSFVLCVLDHKNSGFLLTAIHNREGTRIYTKQVTNGSTELSLSIEEKQALTKSIK